MLPCYDAMRYLENKCQTSIAINRRSKAVIDLIDKACDEASSVINVLIREMGIKVYMLTGDNAQTATFVANEIGIPSNNVIADVLPQGKVDCIIEL